MGAAVQQHSVLELAVLRALQILGQKRIDLDVGKGHVLKFLLFISRPRYMLWMKQAEQRFTQLRI